MTDAEIIERYNSSENKDRQLSVLSRLTGKPIEEIKALVGVSEAKNMPTEEVKVTSSTASGAFNFMHNRPKDGGRPNDDTIERVKLNLKKKPKGRTMHIRKGDGLSQTKEERDAAFKRGLGAPVYGYEVKSDRVSDSNSFGQNKANPQPAAKPVISASFSKHPSTNSESKEIDESASEELAISQSVVEEPMEKPVILKDVVEESVEPLKVNDTVDIKHTEVAAKSEDAEKLITEKVSVESEDTDEDIDTPVQSSKSRKKKNDESVSALSIFSSAIHDVAKRHGVSDTSKSRKSVESDSDEDDKQITESDKIESESVKTEVEKKRNKEPIVSDDKIRQIILDGGDWRDVMKVGYYAENTAKQKYYFVRRALQLEGLVPPNSRKSPNKKANSVISAELKEEVCSKEQAVPNDAFDTEPKEPSRSSADVEYISIPMAEYKALLNDVATLKREMEQIRLYFGAVSNILPSFERREK